MTIGWLGLISSIGFEPGTFCPAAFRMRSRFVLSPCSSLTRHAGESVSRSRRPHRAGPILQRRLHAFEQRLVSSAAARLVIVRAVALQLAEIEIALGHRLQRLALELGQSVDTTHSSMRSYISSTSTPSLRKISRCGLLRAAAKPSAVM